MGALVPKVGHSPCAIVQNLFIDKHFDIFFFLAPAGGSQWAAQRNDLIQFPVLSLEHVPILCKYSTFTLYICYMMTEVFGSRWCLA